MNNGEQKRRIFKYNLSFYYKSNDYLFHRIDSLCVIRGEFVEDSFNVNYARPDFIFSCNNIDYISCSFALQSD